MLTLFGLNPTRTAVYQRDSAHYIQNSNYSIFGFPVPITARSQRSANIKTHTDWLCWDRNQSSSQG